MPKPRSKAKSIVRPGATAVKMKQFATAAECGREYPRKSLWH